MIIMNTTAQFEKTALVDPPSGIHLWTSSLLGTVVFVSYILWLANSSAPTVKAPVAGNRFIFTPLFFLRFRYVTGAASIIQNGYARFKDRCFVVKRMDTDLTIIHSKYLDELRTVPVDKLNSTHANIHNMNGKYTGLDALLANKQFVNVISHFLNPKINEFSKEMQDELDFAFETDMPKNTEWQQIEVQPMIRQIVSRISSRVLLGKPHCRNKDWLKISIDHLVCIFATTFTLRMFPPILYPVISLLLPQRWQIWRHIRSVKKIMQPIIEEYRGHIENGEEPRTLLHWMIKNATGDEGTNEGLVRSQLSVALASIYTSSQVSTHLLFDLASNPEYLDIIQQEVKENVQDLSHIDPSKLPIMDACLTETLRMNPPLLNAPNRRALQPVTLKDGVVIPKGAMVAFPCHAISMDSNVFPEPTKYKPLREQNRLSSVVTPNKHKLAFGWGTQACPGRFFAAKEIKMFVARLVSEYDIKLVPGTETMTRCFDLEDYRVLNPRLKLLMRRKDQPIM